jgi:hypothetical protein
VTPNAIGAGLRGLGCGGAGGAGGSVVVVVMVCVVVGTVVDWFGDPVPRRRIRAASAAESGGRASGREQAASVRRGRFTISV